MGFYYDGGGLLRVREFERWPWLVHAFSTRAAGNLREEEARQAFAAQVAGPGFPVLTLNQVHSAVVRLVNGDLVAGLPGDSLIANRPGVLLGVKTADCLPILIVDAAQRAVGAVHAGWRGIAQRIAEKAVGEMRKSFGSEPGSLFAAIGPGIQACCFEVGPEVLSEFAAQFVDAEAFCHPEPPNPALTMLPRQVMTGGHALMRRLDSDRGRIDLAEACRRQLLAARLPTAQIYNSGFCTACDLVRFYSHRREKDATGRLLSVIGVRPRR